MPVERIERKIFLLRGQKVMLSNDLAELYLVEPRVLIQAVKRNIERFPKDFMFQLNWEEVSLLKSQIVISRVQSANISRSQSVILKRGYNIKYAPYAFTEQGVAMLSSVLNSPRAIQVNIEIMRAFVRLRQMLATNANLERRLNELERKHDAQFKVVFDAIRQLMAPPSASRKKIGFQLRERRATYGKR
ncbi:MAG: ORF6N domain-containing protein [Thermodesulfobacteriota bacterium]